MRRLNSTCANYYSSSETEYNSKQYNKEKTKVYKQTKEINIEKLAL
jgi:hypothetical protein